MRLSNKKERKIYFFNFYFIKCSKKCERLTKKWSWSFFWKKDRSTIEFSSNFFNFEDFICFLKRSFLVMIFFKKRSRSKKIMTLKNIAKIDQWSDHLVTLVQSNTPYFLNIVACAQSTIQASFYSQKDPGNLPS